MGLKHLVDKYNIFYVYVPSKISDQIHTTAIMFFYIGILMMQFQVFTFFFLRDHDRTSVTQLSMISVIVAWIFFISHVFFNCFKSLSNSVSLKPEDNPSNCTTNHSFLFTQAAGIRKPNPKLSEYCACLYLPPVLYELNEHGIQADSHSYGSMRDRNGGFDGHPDRAGASGVTDADA